MSGIVSCVCALTIALFSLHLPAQSNGSKDKEGLGSASNFELPEGVERVGWGWSARRVSAQESFELITSPDVTWRNQRSVPFGCRSIDLAPRESLIVEWTGPVIENTGIGALLGNPAVSGLYLAEYGPTIEGVSAILAKMAHIRVLRIEGKTLSAEDALSCVRAAAGLKILWLRAVADIDDEWIINALSKGNVQCLVIDQCPAIKGTFLEQLPEDSAVKSVHFPRMDSEATIRLLTWAAKADDVRSVGIGGGKDHLHQKWADRWAALEVNVATVAIYGDRSFQPMPVKLGEAVTSLSLHDVAWGVNAKRIVESAPASLCQLVYYESGSVLIEGERGRVGKEVSSAIARFTKLQRLVLQNLVFDTNEEFPSTLRNMKELESLRLILCRWPGEGHGLRFPSMPALRELIVLGGEVDDDTLRSLITASRKTIQTVVFNHGAVSLETIHLLKLCEHLSVLSLPSTFRHEVASISERLSPTRVTTQWGSLPAK